MEHFWKEIEGYFTFPDFYSHVARKVIKPGDLCVEMGAYTGQSAAYLIVEALNAGLYEFRLDLVDLEMTRHQTIKNLERVSQHIGKVHECESLVAASRYEDASIDFLFIDADHSYQAIARDIDAWLPKVKPGGMISGHDYKAWRDFGVIQAVTERFERVEIWRGMLGGGDKQMQDNGCALLGGAAMRDLSRIYDEQFYESYNEEQETDIRAAADTLFDVFRPKYAADMGCGPGMMVRRLRELMVNAIGFDGSAHALKKAHDTMIPFLHVMDITGNPLIWNQDLVICTEVAEHVPEHLADRLVDNLCCARDQDGHIVLTAAPPGQGGHDHINEQPMMYWIEKFALRGIIVNDEKTAAVKAGWSRMTRMTCYPANVRVFGR